MKKLLLICALAFSSTMLFSRDHCDRVLDEYIVIFTAGLESGYLSPEEFDAAIDAAVQNHLNCKLRQTY
ncbi:MAG: hypothetical protein QNK37_11650 [Acidobacteriota bacterium]|nr:hypothetical protein [Acidobacteriota bacterium]